MLNLGLKTTRIHVIMDYIIGEVVVHLQLKCTLSTLMGQHRLKIQDVHLRSGLSRNTVSSLYNDKATRIDYDTVVRLCSLFECSIEDLFVLTDTKD